MEAIIVKNQFQTEDNILGALVAVVRSFRYMND